MSPYLRVGRGEYTLRAAADRKTKVATETVNNADEVAETGALRAFGMFWRRDLIVWIGTPKLLGKQGTGATDVNFAEQIGVYLLHDRERVIYVGRAVDTPFCSPQSSYDRPPRGEWDRFSWFGLLSVGDDGELSDSKEPWSRTGWSRPWTVLIESLEPPLNRRRGDNFSGAEYIQATDPRISAASHKELLARVSGGLSRVRDVLTTQQTARENHINPLWNAI